MNKVVNVFSLILIVVFTLMGMTIIFDLSISNFHLKALPYKVEILSGLAVIVFLLGLLRIRRRWQGVKDMNNFQQFDFSSEVSKSFMKREKMFTLLEILFMIAPLVLFIRLAQLDLQLMLVMIAVLSVLALESIIFLSKLLKGGQAFRIGVNKKVIAYFGREMHLYFYDGLQRVELYQNDVVSFKYKDDLVMFLPIAVLPQDKRIQFRDQLIEHLEAKSIYYDDAFRNMK